MDQPINADYLLEMAERIERNGAGFYRLAVSYVQNPVAAQVLLQLAEMEAEHEQTFAKMRRRLAAKQETIELDPNSETAIYLRGLLTGKFFDPRSQPADFLKDGDSPEDVLLTAIGLEKETIVFYEGVKRVMSKQDGPVVEKVLAEEMKHLSQLVGQLRP